MSIQDGTLIALSIALVGLIGVLIKGVVLPIIKKKIKNEDHSTNDHLVGNLLKCEASKYENRISTLEQHKTGVDARLRNSDSKMDEMMETTGKIKTDVAVVRKAIEWMQSDQQKRNGDGDQQ